MKRFLNKADQLKNEFTNAYDLFKSGLISALERKFIQMQIFKELAKYYRSIGMFSGYDYALKQAKELSNILKVDAPHMINA